MKKGALHFLGRKNQSLFDTNIKIKEDMDNVELVLGSSAIPESGTASVRARPTVKHHSSSSESFQAYAVPTPKVPVLPSVNGPKTNGSVTGNHLSNGSFISVPDLTEEEIIVPPPPSMAPPPPPGIFIPPPDFMGDLNTLNLAALQPAPTPTSLAPVLEGEDLTFVKPPAMAPPKPPSTSSSGSLSSVPISASSPLQVPERPAFAPPEPPSHKTHKKPPPKPIRLSSISTSDDPPETPAPPPPAQTPTLSTFNPQNAAKVYSVPQTSILSGYEEHDTRPKQMLLLEDSTSVNSAPVLVQVDGKAPKVASPSKPALRDAQDLMQDFRATQQSQSPLPEPNKEAETGIVSAQPKMDEPPQTSPQLQKLIGTQVNAEPTKDKLESSPGQTHLFSPIIDWKLRNLKSSETNGARDAPAASPLALLMAAKERDKHKQSHPLSQENSAKTNEQPSASIHPSDSSPNSFIITPMSSSSSSITSLEKMQESLKSISPVVHTQTIQTPVKPSSPTPVKDQMPSASVTPSLVEQKLNAVQSPSKSQPTQPEELSMPLLPPPPEFDDFDGFMEPPPSIPPPDPPKKKAPLHSPSYDPPPPPKPKPPAAPKLPPPDNVVKPRLQIPTKPVVNPAQLPPTLSQSQATLLSILQKKMLEMDHKMAPAKEAESTSDDWGAPLSEEDNKVPVVPTATPQSKNYPAVNKVPIMQELESKVKRKTSSIKTPTSNGTQSKHQYGMTFTVRPGTKQPITLVSKGDP